MFQYHVGEKNCSYLGNQRFQVFSGYVAKVLHGKCFTLSKRKSKPARGEQIKNSCLGIYGDFTPPFLLSFRADGFWCFGEPLFAVSSENFLFQKIDPGICLASMHTVLTMNFFIHYLLLLFLEIKKKFILIGD